MPSDKDGYVDTYKDEEITEGNFVTEQHRWEDSKLGFAVMKFGAKDAKKKQTVSGQFCYHIFFSIMYFQCICRHK